MQNHKFVLETIAHLPLLVITSTSSQPHRHFLPNPPPRHNDTRGSTTAPHGQENAMSPRDDNSRGSLRLYNLARAGGWGRRCDDRSLGYVNFERWWPTVVAKTAAVATTIEKARVVMYLYLGDPQDVESVLRLRASKANMFFRTLKYDLTLGISTQKLIWWTILYDRWTPQ